MPDKIVARITERGNVVPKELTACVSLRYVKEYYTPYSVLNAAFLLDGEVGEIVTTELYVNGFLIHKGLTDSAEVRVQADKKLLVLASRGYSSLLAQNEVTPGTYTKMTLNRLMDTMMALPNVGHEDISAPVDFLYVGYGTKLWEGIVSLCLKQYDTCPYVAHTNTVRFTAPSGRRNVALSEVDGNILSYGWVYDYSRLVSDYRMMDPAGAYNMFNRSEPAVLERGIIRQKHIPFDEQWAVDPQRGLGHRLGENLRGFRGFNVRYAGFQGEDLRDVFTWRQGGYSVSRIEIKGSGVGVSTQLTAYFDRYLNV